MSEYPMLVVSTMGDPKLRSGGVISAAIDEEYRWLHGPPGPTIHDVVTWDWPARPRDTLRPEHTPNDLYAMTLRVTGWVDAYGAMDPDRDPDPEGVCTLIDHPIFGRYWAGTDQL